MPSNNGLELTKPAQAMELRSSTQCSTDAGALLRVRRLRSRDAEGARIVIAQKPDFSGEWKLNRQASMLSPVVAPVVRRGELRIEHREPRFAGHLTVVFEDKSVESKFELLSDGREVVATDDRGQRIVSSLHWDGDALVAIWRIQATGGELTISFRYELQNGGRGLRAAEQFRGGGRDQDNLWIFERS